MNNKINKLFNITTNRLAYIAIGAMVFMVLGRGFVMTATMLLPTKFFYEIQSPVVATYLEDKKAVRVDLHRHSRLETDSQTTVEITVKVIEDGYRQDVQIFKRTFISKGEEDIREVFILDRPLDAGVYELRGVVRFRVNGVDKVEHFYSNEFVVEGKVNTDGTR